MCETKQMDAIVSHLTTTQTQLDLTSTLPATLSTSSMDAFTPPPFSSFSRALTRPHPLLPTWCDSRAPSTALDRSQEASSFEEGGELGLWTNATRTSDIEVCRGEGKGGEGSGEKGGREGRRDEEGGGMMGGGRRGKRDEKGGGMMGGGEEKGGGMVGESDGRRNDGRGDKEGEKWRREWEGEKRGGMMGGGEGRDGGRSSLR